MKATPNDVHMRGYKEWVMITPKGLDMLLEACRSKKIKISSEHDLLFFKYNFTEIQAWLDAIPLLAKGKFILLYDLQFQRLYILYKNHIPLW